MYLDNIDSPKSHKLGIRKSLVFQDSPTEMDQKSKVNLGGNQTLFQ